MKANEIRQGNYAYYKFWNPEPNNERYSYSQIQIIGFLKDKFYFNFLGKKEVIKVSDLEPIRLTEKWLLNFGFNQIYNTRNEHHPLVKKVSLGKEIEIYPPSDDLKKIQFYRFVVVGVRCQSFEIYIKYVHQLQNLYFALTGEELTIKEQ